MIKILSFYIAAFAARRPSSVTLIYLALATVHAVAAYFYLEYGSVPHAVCAILASILYLLLAYSRGLAH